MSATSSPPLGAGNEKIDYSKDHEKVALGQQDVTYDTHSVDKGEDILSMQDVDPALNAKMHIVNNVREFLCADGSNATPNTN
jgi:hypothetical protein